ncbi:MAG: sodium:proton antiporter [Succinivibrionaceae bacterium]|nr:sodium:proton antiporter [Succinivibrionaceae bacterium]
MSSGFLELFVTLLTLIVAFGYVNERFFHLSHEIALMLFSMVVSVLLILGASLYSQEIAREFAARLQPVNIENFLMNGALCFMLFAGSCHMRLSDFKSQMKAVSILSFIATLLATVIYGLAFYGLTQLCGIEISLPVCLLFGSIVSPTDPIAATSILNKFGLPRVTGFLIEGESLLNDGVGVALFVCLSGLVTSQSGGGNFFDIMIHQVFGAATVGVLVTAVCYWVFKNSRSDSLRVFSSLLAVSLSYIACQELDCSGPIASVVCGVMFSTFRESSPDPGIKDLPAFDGCWSILDSFLNSVLYVILGSSIIYVMNMPNAVTIALLAIACNLIGRGGSVMACTFMMSPLPDGFSRKGFTTLLTWGGLRGGLCIALAMSTKEMVDPNTYNMVMGGTYTLVFFTTVVQGLTLRRVYARIAHH